MYVFLAIIIIIASILLIGAVLIQKSKGGGLASNYAGGNQYMGYRKTTDFIEKATWTLAVVICVLSICCAFAIKSPKATSSHIVTQSAQQVTPNAAPGTNATPAAGTNAAPAAPTAPAAGTPATPATPATPGTPGTGA